MNVLVGVRTKAQCLNWKLRKKAFVFSVEEQIAFNRLGCKEGKSHFISAL